MAVLGLVTVDPIAAILGTPYQRFSSPFGIDGLAWSVPSRLDLLAVSATIPRTGQFRRFIRGAQAEYETICVWEVWNHDLAEALVRYGFQPAEEEQNGEILRGFRWDRLVH